MSPTTTIATSTTATSTSSATATCVSVAPGKNGYLPPDACGNLLYYVPSFGAAIVFCILFTLAVITHFTQMVVYKKWYSWVIIMGAAWELTAMIFRVLLTRSQNNANYNMFNQLFFLLAPLWINAFLYMTLGRMVWFFDETKRLAGLSPKRFGQLFVCLDILSFIVQAIGAVITSGTNESQTTLQNGIHIYMGGIGLQQFFIIGFTSALIALHRRLIRQDRRSIMMHRLYNGTLPWKWLFYGMYFALTMITIRIIYRLIEFAPGTSTSNTLITHEAYEYALDATPMFLALAVLSFTHPGRIINGPDSSWPRLTRAQKKEAKRERKAEKAARKAGKSFNNSDVAFESLRPAEEAGPQYDHQPYDRQYDPRGSFEEHNYHYRNDGQVDPLVPREVV